MDRLVSTGSGLQGAPLSQEWGLISSVQLFMLPYPQELASGAERPKPNRRASPGSPQDSILCSHGCWEGWSCHPNAPSKPIPPSSLGPEMRVDLLWGSRPPLGLPDEHQPRAGGWKGRRLGEEQSCWGAGRGRRSCGIRYCGSNPTPLQGGLGTFSK